MMDIDVFVLCCITDLHNAGFKYLMYLCICAVGEKLFDPLLILYVCPLTKKWSVYNLMVGLFEQWETE